jgi:tetratricopeptide (TPR) repeat protein
MLAPASFALVLLGTILAAIIPWSSRANDWRTYRRFRAGYELLSRSEPKEAIRRFDEVESAGMQSWELYYYRGFAREQSGDEKGALHDYDRAAALRQDNADLYGRRGYIRHRLGDLKGAVADYQRALRLAPKHWELASTIEANLKKAQAAIQE